MIRVADVRPCLNCASKVVPVSNCNTCGSIVVRPEMEEVDRKIACAECGAENPTLFVCEKCSNRFLFEEVAGSEKEKFACILCGTFVDLDAKSCPACGAIFEEEPTLEAVAKKERLPRRVKGEFSDSHVDEIARIPGVGRANAEALCRAGYNALWKIKRASEEEIAAVRGIGPRSAKTIKDSLRFILLLPRRKSKEEVLSEEHACPLCGCVTSLFATACLDCGALFDEEEIDDEVRREVADEPEKGLFAFYDVHLEETPRDSALWYARALLLLEMGELQEALNSIIAAGGQDPTFRSAMIVRSRILSAMKETKQAANALHGTLAGLIEEGKAKIEAAADQEVEAAAEALVSLTQLAERECPTCGERVLPDAVVCPACGTKLPAQPSRPPEPGLEALEEPPAAPPEPAPEVPEFAALTELEEMVREPPRRPPPRQPTRAAPPRPAKEEVEEAPAEEEFEDLPEEAAAPEEVEAPPPLRGPPVPPRRPMEGPRPRAREVASPQTRFRRGLINGHGLINGSGRVNGLVNGLGFMDSSALTEFRLPQRSALFRYGIVAGAMLLAFAVAASLIPAPAGPAPVIAIDGNPADWAALPTYADASPASDPNVAIQRYGLYREGDSLSFLVQVSGQALGDATGNDAVYVFFDTDASPTTGYQVRGLGAEYAAEVIGGSNRVASGRLFEFPFDAEVNWSRRVAVAGIPAAASGSTLELRVPTDGFSTFSPTASTILIAADDFDGSSSRAGAGVTATFGAIRIRQVPLLAIIPAGTTPALRLDVSAVGPIPPSDSWTVGPFTFSATAGLTLSPSPAQVTLTSAVSTATLTVSVSAAGYAAGTPLSVSVLSVPAPRPVTVVGEGLRAYFSSVPAGIRVDGLFADWAPLQVPDTDPLPVPRGSLDIRSVAGAANASGTYFMLQVAGPLLEGSVAPQKVPRTPPGGGGGPPGAPPPRVTGEDLSRVFIDTNATDTLGLPIGGMYADYMIEVRGIDGRITRETAFRWQSGWVPATGVALQVAKNATSMEGSLGLSPAQLNGTRMAFETSDWSGGGDVTDVLLTRSADPPTTRTDGDPVPLPEFHEIAAPAALVLVFVLLLRRRIACRTPPTRLSR